MIGIHADCLIHPETGKPTPMTGVQHYVDNLLTALSRIEERPDLAALTLNISPQQLAQTGEGERYRWLRDGKMQLVALEAPERQVKLPRPVDAVRRRLIRYQEIYQTSRQFDLIHLTDPINGLALPLRPHRLVGTIYDMSIRTQAETHLPETVALWEDYFQLARQRFARILTLSEHARREIAASLPFPAERIDVIPLAARTAVRYIPEGTVRDEILARFGLNGQSYVLFTGTLEPRKNLTRLIQAFAQVCRDGRIPADVRLVLAGGSRAGHENTLRENARQAGIEARVLFTGYVSDAEVNALMSGCAVFAYVSFYEGFGLPPLEAMMCGAPVVTSNTSSLPEVMGKAGLLVDPTDTSAIAAALYTLLTDPVENQRQRARSQARAVQFSWERTARETLNTYATALA